MTPVLLGVMLYVLAQLAELHFLRFLYILFAGALFSAIRSTADSARLAASALVKRSTELDRQAIPDVAHWH
jgi:hypothetical protein